MLGVIKDYLLTVLIRMIVGYIIFLSIATIAFFGYALIFDWSDAVALASRLASNEIVSLVVWLPFVLSWFNSSESNNRTSYKFNNHESHHNFTSSKFSLEETQCNPSTGLPMIEGVGGIDVSGTTYGQL